MGWRFVIFSSVCAVVGCSDQVEFDCKAAKTFLRDVRLVAVTRPFPRLCSGCVRTGNAFAQVLASTAPASSSMDQLVREVSMSKQEMAKSLEFLDWLRNHLASVLHEAESLPVGRHLRSTLPDLAALHHADGLPQARKLTRYELDTCTI